jgi:hypothetical protein
MMRRTLAIAGRLTFHLACALSLLALLAVVVLWVRSHRGGDDIGYSGGERRCYVRTGGGEIALELSTYPGGTFRPQFRWDVDARRSGQVYFIQRDSAWKRHGFMAFTSYVGSLSRPTGTVRSVIAPMWAVALPAAVLPCLWVMRAARRGRRRRAAGGLCARCGYDLRASPGRCPECGTEPGAAITPVEA